MLHAIDNALSAMFPRRVQTEALLDLAERKGWTAADREEAIRSFVRFLTEELGLPAQTTSCAVNAPDVRDLAMKLTGANGDLTPGVAGWIKAVAPALGMSAKTLANSGPYRLSAGHSGHRWLAWLARTPNSEPVPQVWLFSERSCAAVATWLGRWERQHIWDAADALLLVSLIALWQRRRPVADARGQRGTSGSRRSMPKPVARLDYALCQLGQVGKLADLLVRLHGDDGALRWLPMVLECTLTAAHLRMHPDRRSGAVDRAEDLMRLVELQLGRHPFGAIQTATWRWRIEMMRAWRDRRDPGPEPVELAADPYAQVIAFLAKRRRFPGLAGSVGLPIPWMLQPQVNALKGVMP